MKSDHNRDASTYNETHLYDEFSVYDEFSETQSSSGRSTSVTDVPQHSTNHSGHTQYLVGQDWHSAPSPPNQQHLHDQGMEPIEVQPEVQYTLTPVGQIMYASASLTDTLGYANLEFVNHNIMEFLHADDVQTYVHIFNEALNNGTPLHLYQRFHRKSGEYVIFETNGEAMYDAPSEPSQGHSKDPTSCKSIALTSRVFIAPTTDSLNELLELQQENAKLQAQLEGYHNKDDQLRRYQGASINEVLARFAAIQAKGLASQDQTTCTREDDMPSFRQVNYEQGSNSSSQDDRQRTKSVPSGSSYTSGSSRMTAGTNRANSSPGLLLTLDGHVRKKNNENNNENHNNLHDVNHTIGGRKIKGEAGDRYICTDCQTTDTPEWRKGPRGPKTLCNACGLRYSKRSKKVERPDDRQEIGTIQSDGAPITPTSNDTPLRDRLPYSSTSQSDRASPQMGFENLDAGMTYRHGSGSISSSGAH